MLIEMFSMQLLNIFFLLQDLMNRFFNENRKFSKCYESVHSVFIVVTCIIYKFLFFLESVLLPGTLTILGTW